MHFIFCCCQAQLQLIQLILMTNTSFIPFYQHTLLQAFFKCILHKIIAVLFVLWKAVGAKNTSSCFLKEYMWCILALSISCICMQFLPLYFFQGDINRRSHGRALDTRIVAWSWNLYPALKILLRHTQTWHHDKR